MELKSHAIVNATGNSTGEESDVKRDAKFVENLRSGGGVNAEPDTRHNTGLNAALNAGINTGLNGGLLADPESDDEQIVVFYPTWRSQLLSIAGFFILCTITPIVGYYIPMAVITGKLFEVGENLYLLTLPIFALVPGVLLGKILVTAYNSEYIIDSTGVEARIGLVGYSLRQPRLRYEDIRGVEPIQNIWERFLGIGSLLVGSAMMSDVEIVMEGIIEPRKVQQYINRRREAGRRRYDDRNKGHAS